MGSLTRPPPSQITPSASDAKTSFLSLTTSGIGIISGNRPDRWLSSLLPHPRDPSVEDPSIVKRRQPSFRVPHSSPDPPQTDTTTNRNRPKANSERERERGRIGSDRIGAGDLINVDRQAPGRRRSRGHRGSVCRRPATMYHSAEELAPLLQIPDAHRSLRDR